MSEQIINDLDEGIDKVLESDFLDEAFNFESYALKVEHSITYKDKTLDAWAKELSVPSIEDNQTLEEVEQLNYLVMKITETVLTNVALTKSTCLSARAAHSLNMQKAKQQISKSADTASTKRLTADALERMCLDKCMNTWRMQFMAEVVYEFWNTQSYKMNSINSRLTSLNIIKNIESKSNAY